MTVRNNKLNVFLRDIKKIVYHARLQAVSIVNLSMLKAYFDIGRRIVEEEQKGRFRARYGERLIDYLSSKLSKEFGQGFDVTNIRRMRRFYMFYGKWETLSPRLGWSHYCELMKIKDEEKRKYYEQYITKENLSVRDLKRQIYSMHYERLLMSKDKRKLIKYEQRSISDDNPKNFVKDPYILEFLGLENKLFTEKDLESRIMSFLQKFLLELGQGFSFIARQKSFNIDNDHYYIDLLFYHIYLRCYIVVEIKTEKFKHEHVGQMNFYLNYVKKNLNKRGDNPPIGIILCSDKNNIQVEFALTGLSNRMFVSRYQIYLPSKKLLESELKRLAEY